MIIHFGPDPDTYFWRDLGADGHWRDVPSRGNIDALCAHLREAGSELWLLLPGDHIVCDKMTFSAKEKRHLARLVPFQFEEAVAADVDDMHFALCEPGEENVAVAYTERDWFRQRLGAFTSRGVDLHYCVPEPLVLPRADNGWTLSFGGLAYGGQVSVSYGDNLGFAIEAALLTPALEALLAQAPAPESIRLLADDSDALETLRALLPADIEAEVEAETLDMWDRCDLEAGPTPPINLRQGEFARRLPFEKWWLEWRQVAAVALVAVVLYGGLNLGGYQVLKSEHLSLRQQTEQAYRTAVPRGRISDPERQLKTKVQALQGGGEGSGATVMIGTVAPLIAGNEELTLQGMNYTDQRGELRLTLEAKTFNAIEKLRVSVEQKGLQAELLNSSAQGEVQQARMRIKRQI
ncbi:type II secretion system protein GspL [Exilibacterium tricleocarpae]|uniref:type II secretion system protein GspL n=1 Tax=Exilibacterium tricleocarpae TaxID=2591008 RepID=UPI001FEC6835|nr:type II secretion system protein GspL [Exilibacterium tricleocarpae]